MFSRNARNPVRIPRSEICKLACKAKSAGIFAQGEYLGLRYAQIGTQGVSSIKQVFPAAKPKEYGRFVRAPFHTPCSVRYSVLRPLGVLSGGKEPPFTQGSLWFVRHESLSALPDKHCFCGHKSEAMHKLGRGLQICNPFFDVQITRRILN